MSTRQTTGVGFNPVGSDVDPDFHVPACTIEDMDRALFNLFDKELPLFYKTKKSLRRVPIIFATGERFAILRRKKPLRDKAGAIILPLISIMRSGVEQTVSRGMGTNQNGEITIKKRLSPKDPIYQRLLNKEAFKNQDDMATSNHFIKTKFGGTGAKDGTVATRRPAQQLSSDYRSGKYLNNKLGNNFFEIYTLPVPKYFMATYEITIWTQYTQQMNDLLSAIMSSYHSNAGRTFRIETDKGYWFVAYFGSSMSPANNFDDFSDDERLVRYSFSVEVPGYLVNPNYPGSQPTHRRFISAPSITFNMTQVNALPGNKKIAGIPSGKPDDYVLQNLKTMDDPAVSSLVGEKGVAAAPKLSPSVGEKFYQTTTVGGEESGESPITVLHKVTDPITGEVVKKELKIKTRNQRTGETVYRDQITYDLGNLVIEPK